MKKKDLLKFMHESGFYWITDVAYVNGIELVASKIPDSEELWWSPIEVEGSWFEQLFRGSIKKVEGAKKKGYMRD